MVAAPPLTGIRVLEFAGLAPGPFAGLLLADWGASVLRLDRATSSPNPEPTNDVLTRRKTSIAVDLKQPGAIALIKELLKHVDVVIDPYRPGVLERLGLSPQDVMLPINQHLVIARMTGFRRDGKYSQMAGHDIDYVAVSGVLSLLGRRGEKPMPAGNLIGDFAGGGLMCFLGIVLALFARTTTGRGQIVEANMVDGASFLATMPRLSQRHPIWNRERGDNLLDSGSPYYNVYETKDRQYVAVGCLEPQFFNAFLKGLEISPSEIPGHREDRATWLAQKELYTRKFLTKPRLEWEAIFDGTDACVTPILSLAELDKSGYDNRPAVALRDTPSFAISQGVAAGSAGVAGQGQGVPGDGWSSSGMAPGHGGKDTLKQWLGWEENKDFHIANGGLVKAVLAKL